MGTMSVGRIRGGFVIRLCGHGTLRESRTMVNFLEAAPVDSRIDLDLSHADWVDSTFLGSLMGLHKRLNPPGTIRFRICAQPEHTHRLFGRTRLDTVLPQAPASDPVRGPEEAIPESAMVPGSLAGFVADCHRRLAELGGPDSAAYQSVADAIQPPKG